MGQIQGALVGIAMVFRRYLCQWPSSAAPPVPSIAVLYYHCCGDGAVSTGSDDPPPALCATLLKPLKKGEHHGQKAFLPGLTRCLTATPNATKKGGENSPP